MIKSIEHLVYEHENIKRMLDVVRAASLRVLAGEAVPAKDFHAMIAFIRNYADKTHHGKEEEFLFKAMLAELGMPGQNLIRSGMLVEHDLGRLYVSDLENAVNAYAAEPTEASRLDILVAAGSYVNLLRRHIDKENAAVFPFGDRQLSAEALAAVDADSERFEADPANTAVREEQLQVLADMAAKYL